MSNNLGTTHCGIVLNCFLYFYLSLSPSVSLIHIHMDMNNIKKKKKLLISVIRCINTTENRTQKTFSIIGEACIAVCLSPNRISFHPVPNNYLLS